MAENDLKVIQKAKELATHTLKVTSNANRYPKKYRFSLVDKMQNKSMEIYEMLFEANRTDIKNYKRDRLEMQTKAISVKRLFRRPVTSTTITTTTVTAFAHSVLQGVRVGIKPKSGKIQKGNGPSS